MDFAPSGRAAIAVFAGPVRLASRQCPQCSPGTPLRAILPLPPLRDQRSGPDVQAQTRFFGGAPVR